MNREYHGDGWRIVPKALGWVAQIDNVAVTAERGLGLETLLVITKEKTWQPAGETLTTDGLLCQLDESVAPDNWRAGWVNYRVKRKDEN